jgi:cytochrome c oxidase subunit 3
MPSALSTETVLIHAPEKPFVPATGGPQGPPPEDRNPFGRGGGGDDDDARRKPSNMGLFGMQLALIPVTVLFIATAFVFFLRSRTGFNWRAVPVPSLLWLSTVLILISSWTLEQSRRGLRNDLYGTYSRWLIRTFYLGMGFLLSQALGLQQLFSRGFFMRHNPHSSLFYLVTVSHALHLLGGLIALGYLLLRAGLHWDASAAGRKQTRRIGGATALYWHFLSLLWLCLFLFLLLWQ